MELSDTTHITHFPIAFRLYLKNDGGDVAIQLSSTLMCCSIFGLPSTMTCGLDVYLF